MFAVTRKLKALKLVFREQRRKKGDLTLNVQLAKGFLDEAQQLVSSDRQNEAFLLLEHCCRLVYAKAAKLEQIMLQQRAKMQWMKGGDQCSQIFFRKIAKRRVARRILQINDDNGTIHTEPEEIINEFVCYYQNLLGGNRRQIILDIGFLRPWARHILSNEEAGHLILAFTPDDVKQAVFDIADDKAPGPDGYSSGFFKAAWPVVGQEVTKAVLEFFSTSKLLKQVNSTLLALIPKVHTPMTIGDFRSISCCNVLYKIIAKLLVQRLSVVLDKIISPCQGAFIPGRSIGDNILLAQELLTGYNQVRLPPHCTLKVDIRKAYDTVEWDFLLAVLQFFEFPQTFTRWIEECVTTAAFSIGLNGNPHDFFAGARGLRQGDPLSPYLRTEKRLRTFLWKGTSTSGYAKIHGGDDRINWRFSEGRPTTQSLYRLFCPPGPKVGWSSLLSGSLKIPRHNFIVWLAVQEKLPTTDKPWMTHLGGCILCDEGAAETHTHMFFRCRYSRGCLAAIRHHIRFTWPNREWTRDVEWASRKWRGKHIVNVAYRALLGACIYHIWRERNLRRFEHTHPPEAVLATCIIEDVRQRIISINLSSSISTCALYRLWRIPWSVGGTTI
ncbi:UNVERIFIED_CONTAM: hypothetical protein Sindi_2017600 [Sesamum indicum]